MVLGRRKQLGVGWTRRMSRRARGSLRRHRLTLLLFVVFAATHVEMEGDGAVWLQRLYQVASMLQIACSTVSILQIAALR